MIHFNNIPATPNHQAPQEADPRLGRIPALAIQAIIQVPNPNEAPPTEEGNIGEEVPDYTDPGPVEESNFGE